MQKEVYDWLNQMPLPDLGDDQKRYSIELTEPEINAIWSVIAFARSNCSAVAAHFDKPSAFWGHYGPTLSKLEQRLRVFDDGNAKAQK